MQSDWKSGRVEIRWRPEARFDLARLKKDLFTWRGGVRYGGADLVAVGRVEMREGYLAIRVDGSARGFELRAPRGVALPTDGAQVRVVGAAAFPRQAGGADLVLTVREWEPVPKSLP